MSKEPIISNIAVYHYELCCDDWDTLVDNVLDVMHHAAYMLEDYENGWEIAFQMTHPGEYDPGSIHPEASFKEFRGTVMRVIFHHFQECINEHGWEDVQASIELRFLDENFMPELKAFRQLQDKYLPIAGAKKLMEQIMEKEDLPLLEEIHTITEEFRTKQK